eukprot:6375745-Lingulodinium_polyedra.AAC.1
MYSGSAAGKERPRIQDLERAAIANCFLARLALRLDHCLERSAFLHGQWMISGSFRLELAP